MTEYIDLEDEEIIYYVYNLNWQLPKETQDEAIEYYLVFHQIKWIC